MSHINPSKFRLMLSLSVGLMLSACSGSDEPEASLPEPKLTEVPEINQARTFTGPLVKAGQSSVRRFINNGIYSATQSAGQMIEPTAALDSDSEFSSTNTQEVGVDEADRMEYDGNYLYLAAYPQWIDGNPSQPHVRVMQRNDDFSLSEVTRLNVEDEKANITGIYHDQQRLAVVSSSSHGGDIMPLIEPWFDVASTVVIDIYDTTLPAESEKTLSLEFDGSLLSSRRIDNQLYLVTSYVPTVDDLNPEASTDAELLSNYLSILDASDSELMPKMYTNGIAEALNSPEDCAIPEEATEKDGYAQLVTIIRINIQQPEDINASCMSALASVIYMSKDNIYLAGILNNPTDVDSDVVSIGIGDSQTVLHKIALNNDLSYQASGIIDGVIGWRSAANLRLSEKDGYLRIVSSDYQQDGPLHRLFILNQQGNELQTVATLPNDDSPAPLGKPGEDIFAVRFFDDRGYIVTFEQVDPLYVLDLSNPLAPQVVGTLEVPGFSSYLHPLDNNYLLGVGQQISTSNIPETGSIPTEPVTQQGMKVSLFDVSNPAAPIEVNSVIKENGYTPIEYDYRALSVLNISGSYQFAMPLEQWTVSDEISFALWTPISSLLLLEVDTQAAAPQLIERAQISASNEQEFYIYGGDDRSVIHGEHVYYIHGNQVWHSLWQSEPTVDGPY